MRGKSAGRSGPKTVEQEGSSYGVSEEGGLVDLREERAALQRGGFAGEKLSIRRDEAYGAERQSFNRHTKRELAAITRMELKAYGKELAKRNLLLKNRIDMVSAAASWWLGAAIGSVPGAAIGVATATASGIVLPGFVSALSGVIVGTAGTFIIWAKVAERTHDFVENRMLRSAARREGVAFGPKA